MGDNFNGDGYMNHNVITVNGLEYKAVKSINEDTCNQCAFLMSTACSVIHCMKAERDDNERVIFKRHIKLKSK